MKKLNLQVIPKTEITRSQQCYWRILLNINTNSTQSLSENKRGNPNQTKTVPKRKTTNQYPCEYECKNTLQIISKRNLAFIPGVQDWFSIWKPINIIQRFNNLDEKNHMITSIDAQNTPDKFNNHAWLKTLRKLGMEENVLNLIKNSCFPP